MSLVFIGLGVLLLLLLMVVFKLNAFISLIIVSLIVAVLEGMSPLEAIASVEKGLGSTLGHLALVLGICDQLFSRSKHPFYLSKRSR